MVARKQILRLTAMIAWQIVYYVLLSYSWMLLGWQYEGPNFLGGIAVIAWLVNPFLCAYVGRRVTIVQKKLYAAFLWLVLLCIVLVCAPLSNFIWLHASGYYHHALSNPNDYLGETVAVNQFIDILGMFISGVFFVISVILLKPEKKDKSRTLPD
jgi:hypothetical protein